MLAKRFKARLKGRGSNGAAAQHLHAEANHCGLHFPKDYCRWTLFRLDNHGITRTHPPLPHPHSRWLKWLADQSGGNRHPHSNPAVLMSGSPVGSSHRPSLLSLPFIAAPAPMQVGPHDRPFLPAWRSGRPPKRWDWRTGAWAISKGRGVTSETRECV